MCNTRLFRGCSLVVFAYRRDVGFVPLHRALRSLVEMSLFVCKLLVALYHYQLCDTTVVVFLCLWLGEFDCRKNCSRRDIVCQRRVSSGDDVAEMCCCRCHQYARDAKPPVSGQRSNLLRSCVGLPRPSACSECSLHCCTWHLSTPAVSYLISVLLFMERYVCCCCCAWRFDRGVGVYLQRCCFCFSLLLFLHRVVLQWFAVELTRARWR